mmetsp:Transcript_3884/g.5223  ORF Transcript_3884/g.5223 Transcript_3884/m.5223 type:complete len:216 (-) Transcript_3884:343-990(-)
MFARDRLNYICSVYPIESLRIDKFDNDLLEMFTLPKGTLKNIWIAEHAEIFVESISRLYEDYFSTSLESQEFDSGEGFPTGTIYHIWSHENESIKVSATEYIQFTLGWAQDHILNERSMPAVESQFLNTYERDVVKVIFLHVFRVFLILFYFQSNYPVKKFVHEALDSEFDRFIVFCMYWGLLDFESEDVKLLGDYIDQFRQGYEQARQLLLEKS